MSTQYVTIKQDDPEFLNYLWGQSEIGLAQVKKLNNHRAIPVKTYNLGTAEELVTFELKSISDISRPSKFIFFSSIIKLNSFIIILFPLFFVLTKNYVIGPLADPLSIILAAVSSVLLFAGLNIRNDVNDHISGFDRVNLDLNNKPIRLGWISPFKASRISLILILISGILALPVVLVQPKVIVVIVSAIVLFLIGRFFKNNSYKQQHFGEAILFLLIGPALAAGYQLALGSSVDSEIISFGALWGFAVLYLIQANNFAHIMTSSQSRIKNTMTKLGFDLAQKYMIITWVFFIAFWFLFHTYFAGAYWTAFSTVVLLLCSLPLFMKISNIKSPMGSGLQAIRKEAYKIFTIMVFIFLFENFWYLWRA